MNLNINQLTLSNNITTNIYRTVRVAGRYFTAIGTTGKDTFISFRLVLEYPEDARCTNIWY